MLVYVFLGWILFVVVFILVILWNIRMDLCSIMAHTERTYEILSNWAIYYVVSEHQKGNNEPFDYIFPNDRKKMEQELNHNNK